MRYAEVYVNGVGILGPFAFCILAVHALIRRSTSAICISNQEISTELRLKFVSRAGTSHLDPWSVARRELSQPSISRSFRVFLGGESLHAPQDDFVRGA